MRPTSRKVSMSMAKMTCELFTTIQPTPSRTVIDCATSPRLEAVGAEENLVLHPFGLGVVIGERGVAVLEISLVGDEQSPPRGRELLRRAVVPLHAAREQHEAACGRECVSYDPFHVPQTVRSVRRRAGDGGEGRPENGALRRSDSDPKPAGANPYGKAGLLTRPVRRAFPVCPSGKECGKTVSPRRGGTYSSEHCSGFSPDSLFIRAAENGRRGNLATAKVGKNSEYFATFAVRYEGVAQKIVRLARGRRARCPVARGVVVRQPDRGGLHGGWPTTRPITTCSPSGSHGAISTIRP